MKIYFAAFILLFSAIGSTRAQEVGPGSQTPDPTTIPGLFRTICLDTLPDFAGSESRMLASGLFLLNESSGIIYHQTLNFSAKIQENEGRIQCSVVFYSDQPTETVGTILEEALELFKADIRNTYPSADLDVLSGTGDSTGFHRMAIILDSTH